MSLATLLADLDCHGITLAVEHGQLRYKAPRGTLTDDLKARIAEHKPLLVQMLTTPKPRQCGCGNADFWWRAIKCSNGNWIGDWLCSRCSPDPAGQHSRAREPP